MATLKLRREPVGRRKPSWHRDPVGRRAHWQAGILLVLSIANAPRLPAIEWPNSDALIDTSFGTNASGRPMAGINFSGEDQVRSADSGEIIYSTTNPLVQTSFTQALGAWTAIDHGDGMVSLYGHLSPRLDKESRHSLEKGSILGTSGSSGWAAEPGFYFALFDRIAKRWVNPVLLASQRLDDTQPIIRQVLFTSRDGTAVNPRTTPVLRQGTWRILVEAADNETAKGPLSLGPKDISCLVNGIEVQSLSLDYLSVTDGDLMIPGTPLRAAREVFTKDGSYDLGEVRLKRGRTTIQISVRDAVGNERQVSYTLRIE